MEDKVRQTVLDFVSKKFIEKGNEIYGSYHNGGPCSFPTRQVDISIGYNNSYAITYCCGSYMYNFNFTILELIENQKVISIKQPWTWLIGFGLKDIENRTWKTNFRGRILIHASATYAGLRNPNSIFTMEQWYSLTANQQTDLITRKMNKSAIIGSIEIVDCVKNHTSIWAEKDVYNWVLSNPILFKEPILNVKGKLGLWNYKN